MELGSQLTMMRKNQTLLMLSFLITNFLGYPLDIFLIILLIKEFYFTTTLPQYTFKFSV